MEMKIKDSSHFLHNLHSIRFTSKFTRAIVSAFQGSSGEAFRWLCHYDRKPSPQNFSWTGERFSPQCDITVALPFHSLFAAGLGSHRGREDAAARGTAHMETAEQEDRWGSCV